ncbi:MAG: 4-hydroxy-tetrahydrodipicolinate synthase [Pseudomonadota bacterium]
MISLEERLKDIFCPVFCPMITPTDGDGHVDENSMRKLVRRLLQHGIQGLVVMGSSGELQAISDEEKKKTFQIVIDEVKGKVPVVMGGGDTDVKRAIKNIKMAEQQGADAVLAVPPYYFSLSQEGVKNYFMELAQTGVPILLYNIPQFTKVRIEPDTVIALSQIDGIIGIKDSSRDVEYIQNIVFACKGNDTFRVFIGTEGLLLVGLAIGVRGIIGVTPNVAPSWNLELVEAYKGGNLIKAREIQQKIGQLLEALRMGIFPAGLKAAAALLGICNPKMWKPATELSKVETDLVKHKLNKLGIL